MSVDVVDSDSFQWLGTPQAFSSQQYQYLDVMNGKTGSNNLALIVGPQGGGSRAIESFVRTDRDVRHVFANNPHVVGFYVRFPSGWIADSIFFAVYQSGSGTPVFTLQIDASGFIKFTGGSSTTALLTDGGWHYIEVYMSTTDAISPHVVWVDGVNITQKSVLGGFTIGNYWDYVSWFAASALKPIDIGDYYSSYDGNGNGGNSSTSFFGPIRVEYLPPTGAGSHSDFTPTPNGAHWSTVDDAPPNDLTDYVSSPTVGSIDSYTHGSIVSTGAVKAVVVKAFADRQALPSRQLETGVISSGVQGVGVPISLGGGNITPFSPTLVSAVRQFDPNTSAAWATPAVNSSEMMIKVQA